MLRAGRFRHRLLSEQFLQERGPACLRSLDVFLNLWKNGSINDVEIVAVYILVFSFFRRPKDFLGGPQNLPLDQGKAVFEKNISSQEIVQIFRTTLPESLQQAKSLYRLEITAPFIDHFCSLSWRSIPLSVAQSIYAWKYGRYSLKLLTTIPTADEVLTMQAQGQRCISMLIRPEEIQSFVEEGRDVLGFIVHDLIHADHFFADADRARAQIIFCQKLQLVLAMPAIQDMLAKDAHFKNEFHYLMSDMNSVPLHLLKTLKAILLAYFKRQHHQQLNSPLHPSAEADFFSFFESVIKPWNFLPPALAAAQRLNTVHSKNPEDYEILDSAMK